MLIITRKKRLLKLCESWDIELKNELIYINENALSDIHKEKMLCVAEQFDYLITRLRASVNMSKKELFSLCDDWANTSAKYRAICCGKLDFEESGLPCLATISAGCLFFVKACELDRAIEPKFSFGYLFNVIKHYLKGGCTNGVSNESF